MNPDAFATIYGWLPLMLIGPTVPGTPTELPINGERWVSDHFAAYRTPATQTVLDFATLGSAIAGDKDFVMRQVLRGPMFGELELDMQVTAISEEDVPDELFNVPPDFTLIAQPQSTDYQAAFPT